MIRRILKLLPVVAIALLLSPIQLSAQEFTVGDLKYSVTSTTDKEVAVTGYVGTPTDIEIPATITNDGVTYSVTAIGKDGLSINILKSVKIPNSIISIGERAFFHCHALESVTLPKSVTSIGFQAFASGIPGTIESICKRQNIYVEEGNPKYTDIDGVLYNLDKTEIICCPGGRKSVTLPNTLKSIGDAAFMGCFWLPEISIPSSVTSIGQYAFFYCPNLKEITIPNSVTVIEDYTFGSCESLKNIVWPKALTSIGNHAFFNCPFEKITIPRTVTSIADFGFDNCKSLKEIVVPASVTTLGRGIFYDCISLETIFALPQICPETGEATFKKVPKDAIVYVLKSSLESYKTNEVWSYFTDIRELDDIEVTVDDTELKLKETETVTIQHNITMPPYLTVASTEWSTSAPAVATVDQQGSVTAVSMGNATISLTITDNLGRTFTATCEVTVESTSGIDGIVADDASLTRDIYTPQGICLKRNATTDDINALAPGLYIVGEKKIVVR